jgi:hypothetical protein
MHIARRVVPALAAFFAIAACADGRDALGPVTPASDLAAAAVARPVEASGEFAAVINPLTFTFTSRGRNCLITVLGELIFTGTIEGSATGQTTALVFAPCEDVQTAAPGTYPDVFRSELNFEGTVDGSPARAKVLYQGGVGPGGQIDAHLIFSNGVAGVLDADAIVAVGGTYSGSLVVK